MSKFNCKKCKSDKLAYEKFVRCKTPIEINEDGAIVYHDSEIDEDDTIATGDRFCCAKCGHAVLFKADYVKTEDGLKYMLSLSYEERQMIDDEYLAMEFEYADYREEEREDIEEARQFCEEK